MNQFQILIVEDDHLVRNLIAATLKVHEYSYITASSGKEAIMCSVSRKPDLVLLDLGLPDTDGTEVIASIRSWSQMPIIVISARSEEADKIKALDMGADDWVVVDGGIESYETYEEDLYGYGGTLTIKVTVQDIR